MKKMQLDDMELAQAVGGFDISINLRPNLPCPYGPGIPYGPSPYGPGTYGPSPYGPGTYGPSPAPTFTFHF